MSLKIYLAKGFSYLKIFLNPSSNLITNCKVWFNSLINPDKFYLDAFRFFYYRLPKAIRKHKFYFTSNSRGFGEKAFHSMWYLLYKEFNFKNFLEIGIYRGQTISLIALLGKLKNKEIDVYGISPFNNAGDKVSKYLTIDYEMDVIKNFDHFSLKHPILVKAFSTDELATEIIESKLWDCIYIDGSHDYEIAKKDWINCSKNIKIGGIVVLDDASLYTIYNPPFFAFKGHPGPSKVAEEIKDDTSFEEILRIGHNRVFKRIF